MAKKIYCGCKKINKDQEQGTYEQCKKRNQIRLYGLKTAEDDHQKQIKKIEKEILNIDNEHKKLIEKYKKLKQK